MSPSSRRTHLWILGLAIAAKAGIAASAPVASATAAASVVVVTSTVQLSASTYPVVPTVGTAVLSVQRVGSKGAASVNWATSHGTGFNGEDYTGASGTLSWSDGDSSIKKILVKVAPTAAGKTFQVLLTAANTSTTVGTPNIATVIVSDPGSTTPLGAEEGGYKTRTFGPGLKMGTNWFNMSFFGPTGAGGVNNSDGSVTISGDGIGAISTAVADKSKPYHWRGLAFGGGAYFEAAFSFKNADAEKLSPRWPSFWANDIENMAANAVTSKTQWLGQPTGYGSWIEVDFFEYDRQTLTGYGAQLHHWYGFHQKTDIKSVKAFGSKPFAVPTGFKWSDTHKYGFLWVPATATSLGYAQVYLDDLPVGNAVQWIRYDEQSPPEPLFGSTAFNVIDARHMALILDTGPKNPMTIHSVSVWQKSAVNNITE